MDRNDRGQVIVIVTVTLVVLTISIAALVSWLLIDTKWTVKNQKSMDAVNLAEAAIDRAQWKLQSSTSTWAAAVVGTPLAGYNFDTTYSDIPGGTYRVKISSAGNQSVTILGEGRDNNTQETRAISAVYRDQVIYSAIMTQSNVSWGPGLGVYWGPIMAQGNIALTDDSVAQVGFPRKLSGGVVTGTALHPRDTNGLAPPNTDNVEWWSNYQGVPPLPILDFVTLRASAAATGTLNVYGCGCAPTPTYIHDVLVAGVIVTQAVAPWDLRTPAECADTNGGNSPSDVSSASHADHFGNSTNFYNVLGLNPNQNYVWYWDNNVTLEGFGNDGGAAGHATSLRGNVVVRGKLTINSSGDMVYNGPVPANAWVDQQEQLAATAGGAPATFDTAAAGEYPADIGFHQNSLTWNFGNTGLGTYQWTQPGQGGNWYNTVGIRGFAYVGGDLTLTNYLDVNGAIWVNGSVTALNASASNFTGILFDDTLQVPTLNVILLRQSWQEVAPSATPWP
jgi:Tfp pilus assembly protein PilX